LRTALRRGSLIVAADQPEGDASAFRCLGGWLPLDRRPFRLARLARVPCRPLFLFAFRGRLAISIGQALEGDPTVALEAFARSLERAAGDCPLLIDGPTWWTLREAR